MRMMTMMMKEEIGALQDRQGGIIDMLQEQNASLLDTVSEQGRTINDLRSRVELSEGVTSALTIGEWTTRISNALASMAIQERS